MAEQPGQIQTPRPRTATRLKYVAPPGFSVEEPREGVKTIGRYEIIKVLGKGAMGVVYKARDPMLDRIVAVKTIVSPRGQGKRVRRAYLERFEREAKAAAKMQHPSIVTIFDVGLDDGLPFMVLEYLPGESLADRLDRVRMPLGKAVQIALDLASALGFAHKERIVHRDVKPANVLHAGQSRWKLADFGIARMPDSDLTQVGIFMGTPGYAPPEAISQGRYTAQADVFAWGAVLYELLCGRIPYEGPDTRTTNGYVLKTTAKSPVVYDASIPEPLAEVTMRALHPSTEVRYKDGNEAETALRESWELCLQSALISPQALTGQEVEHERAGKAFHATGTPGTQPIAKDEPPPVPPPEPPKTPETPKAPKVPDQIVIEAKRSVSDDDPTSIYQQRRDESESESGGRAPSRRESAESSVDGSVDSSQERVSARTQTPIVRPADKPKQSGGMGWLAAVGALLIVLGGIFLAVYVFLLR